MNKEEDMLPVGSALDADAPRHGPDTSTSLYELRSVRKTYGVRRIPATVFRECRLPSELKPSGSDWRRTCGSYEACRQDCPRCWALWIEELTLERGRTTAILGHSGSGKTTLLYLLALLHTPDPDVGDLVLRFDGEASSFRFARGRWWLGGDQPARLDRVRRQRFGFVFQSGHLSSHLTAEQNVGLSLALAGRPRATIRRRTEEILGRIDFPKDRFQALPRHLSGGEYQRVAVARALAADPDVLFVDEPTGNLDPVTGRTVMELLRSWCAERPERSLILVTHNLDHALEYADDLVVLNGGEVVLVSPKAEARYEDIEHALHRRRQPALRLHGIGDP